MHPVHAWLEQNIERFENDLEDFLRIPSVSTDPERAADVARCAEWVSARLRTIGMDNVVVHTTPGHPIVTAENLKAGSDAPTVLFYGHYDVQPVDPVHLWTAPPFEPVRRDGKIFARGATDDKGQVFLHICALEAMLAVNGSLPVNVKLLIEGEEEIGSPNLTPFVRERAADLACDAVLVSDTAMFAPGKPSLVYGLRGLAYMQIDVQGPNRDLHSGSYGGAVANPLNALASIISKLKSDDGRILIDGFYDGVLELTSDERNGLARLGERDETLKADVGVDTLVGEAGWTTTERLGARPTLDVNGMIGGFTGEGAKTVLPARASAKVSMRLVPNQSTEDIACKFAEYVKKVTPPGVTVSVRDLHGADPVLVPRDTPAMKAATQALQDVFGEEVRFTREGGSIPVVLLFETVLHAPTVLMGFGLHDENAHSPDEHFDLKNFIAGMKATALFYENVAQSS